MKKTILATLLLYAGTHIFAQDTESTLPIDGTTNKVTYAAVGEAPGSSAQFLYENSKKWVTGKNSEVNPYTISYDNPDDGSIVGKGTFTLPAKRKKYVVQFAIKISSKAGKYKYELTDLIVQFHVAAGSSGGGFAYYAASSHHDAETLEYSIETFYPSRLHGRKPAIKYFEGIDEESFATINREMQSIASSLKESMSGKENW